MTIIANPRAHHPTENYVVADSVSQALGWLQTAGYDQLNGNVMVWVKGGERVRIVVETPRLRGCRPGATIYLLGSWWRRSDNQELASIIDERQLVREERA